MGTVSFPSHTRPRENAWSQVSFDCAADRVGYFQKVLRKCLNLRDQKLSASRSNLHSPAPYLSEITLTVLVRTNPLELYARA